MSISEAIANDPNLTEDEAAKFLGIKPNTLAVWRSSRRYDLEYVKVGRLVQLPTVGSSQIRGSKHRRLR